MNDLLTVLLPFLPVVGRAATQVIKERLPRAARPYIAPVLGAAAGLLAHRAGVPPELAAFVGGLAGPGAVAYHHLTKKRVTVTGPVPSSSRMVDPSELPTKP